MNVPLPDLTISHEQRTAWLEMLQRWANINSGTHHLEGLVRMRETLLEDFRILGVAPETIEVPDAEHVDREGRVIAAPLAPALRWTQRLDRPQTVFLCIHMDTVYDRDHPFQHCRWIEREGEAEPVLNGPGVADAKGGLLVLLQGLALFERTSPYAEHIGWEVFVNSDEEIGSPGSSHYFRERAPQHRLGLLFEPTLPDGTMVDRRKGSGNLTCVVRGRAAHAGREFHHGRNALVELARLIQSFAELNRERDTITLNVGQVAGGGAVNIVPDLGIARLNARISEPEDGQWLLQRLQDILVQAEEAAAARGEDGLTRTLHGGLTSPPKIPDDSVHQVQRLIESAADHLGQSIRWQATGGTCDGNKLFAYGLPNIDTLGVRGGAIHSQDEFMIPASLVERVQLTALTLHQFAATAVE